MTGTILITASIIVLSVIVWAIVGAWRYGTRTIRPEDYEDD